MEEPLVFSLTPRAGRWNHRYLVPVGTSARQQDLMKFADDARSGDSPDIICVSRQVQQTSGRSGPEMLVVRDSRLRSASESVRDAVEQELAGLQDSLASIVNEIDWEIRGQQLLVEHEVLTEWGQRVDRLLSQPAQASEPAQRDRSGSRFDNDGRREPHPWKHRVALVGLVLFVLAVFALLLGQPGLISCLRSHSESSATAQSPRDGAISLGRRETTSAPDDSDPLITLARAVGLETKSLPQQQLTEAVLGRLKSELFVPVRSDRGRQQTSPGPEEPANELLRLLQEFHHITQPGSGTTPGSLRDLTRDQSLLRCLRKLLARNGFNPAGLLDDSDAKQANMRLLACQCDYSVIAALLHLAATAPSGTTGDGNIAKVATSYGRLRERFPSSPESTRAADWGFRRFFLPDDITAIRLITDWYASESAGRQDAHPASIHLLVKSNPNSDGAAPVIGTAVAPPTTEIDPVEPICAASELGEYLLAVGRTYQEAESGIFSRSKLRAWAEDQRLNESGEVAFADALAQFLEICLRNVNRSGVK